MTGTLGRMAAGAALGVLGGLVSITGLLAYVYVGQNYSACRSAIGQLGQAASSSVSADCSAVSLAHWAAVAAIPAGLALAAYGIYWGSR